MPKAIVIRPNQSPIVENLDYEGIYKILDDGYIERIRFTDDAYALLDEDGKSKNLPRNPMADFYCDLYEVGLMPDDFIVGVFIIVGYDLNGETQDVPQRLIDTIVQ